MIEQRNEKQRSKSSKPYNYAHFIMDEPEDKNNQLRAEIMKAAHKKMKGQTIKKQSDKDKFIDKESSNMIALSDKIAQEEATYEKICEDMTNLKQYPQVKMVMFEVQISGSSEDEIDPTYQNADDVIVAASGDVEIIQFYLIGKIQSNDGVLIQPMINTIQNLRGAQNPEISIARRIKAYTIYKLTISSLTRKFTVVAKTQKIQLSTSEIKFSSKKQLRLLLDKGFCFNFSNGKKTDLGLLQQIFIYSMFEPTQKQILKTTINKINVKNNQQMSVSNQLIDSISDFKQENKQFFYELVLNFIKQWNIQNKQLTQNQLQVYKILAKTFTKQNFAPFLQQNKFALKMNLYYILIDTLFCITNAVLIHQQKQQLLKKILQELSSSKDFQNITYLLQKILISQQTLLNQICSQQNFVQNCINLISKNSYQRLSLELFSAIYYSKIYYSQGKIQSSIFAIINGITPIDQNQINFEVAKAIGIFTPQLSQILQDNKKFNFKDLEPQYFYKFLKLYPTLQKLNYFSLNLKSNINIQMKTYISKSLLKHLKDRVSFQFVFLILKQFFINQNYKKQFHTQNSYKQFNKIVCSCLKQISSLNSQKDQQYVLMKLNSLIILESIKNKIGLDMEQYVKILKKKSLSSCFRILSCGVDDHFFEKQNNQIIFGDIVTKILQQSIKVHNAHNKPNWCSFKYCYFINERILEKMIYLGRRSMQNTDNLQLANFFVTLQSLIDAQALPEHKQKLKIVILQHNMKLDYQSIKGYLRNKQKLYLKILLNILEKEKDASRKNKVIQVLSIVTSEIEKGTLTFEQLEEMMPVMEKDKQRFQRLFPDNLLLKALTSLNQVKHSINNMDRIKQFLNVIKNKFQINPQQIINLTKKLQDIQEKLRKSKMMQMKNIQKFPQFQQQILCLYQFSFFFKQFPPTLNSIGKVLQKSGEKVSQFKKRLKSLLQGLNNDEFYQEEYSYFGFEQFSQTELKNILKLCGIKNEEKELLKILRLIQNNKKIKFYKQVVINLKQLGEKDNQFIKSNANKFDQILKFTQLIQSNSNKDLKIRCKQFDQKIQLMHQILSSIKLKISKQAEHQIISNIPFSQIQKKLQTLPLLLKGAPATLISLMLMNKRKKEIQKLRGLKGSIKTIQQSVYDNQQQNISLRYQDFQNYKYIIIDFYEKAGISKIQSLCQLIDCITNCSSNLAIHEQSFNRKLISITERASQFQQCYQRIRNPSFNQSVNIKKMVENSHVQVCLIAQPYGFKLKIQVNRSQQIYEQLRFDQLLKYKDEAYLIKSKAEDLEDQKQKQQIIRKVDVFLQMHELLSALNQILRRLIGQGYIVFTDQTKVITIHKENLTQLESELKNMIIIQEKWRQSLLQIYSFSSNATLLKGIKLRNFYEGVAYNKAEKQLQNFRIIINTKQLKDLISKFHEIKLSKILRQNGKNNKKDPFQCLTLLKQFFSFYKTQTQRYMIIAPDREEQYVQILRFPQQNRDYITALNELRAGKLKRFKEGQILTCKADTTKQQVQLFIERLARDIDNQYVLLGYDNLTQELENSVIEKIDESLIKNNNKMKLSIVGKKTAHRLYRYFIRKMNVTKRIQGSEQQAKQKNKQFNDLLQQRILGKNNKYGKTSIYTSSYPGLGKTYQILQIIKANNKQPIFIPLSGRITSENLYKRLKNQITLIGQKPFDLLFQLYQIEEQSIITVNDFIRQISVFRIYDYSMEFICLPEGTKIYLQIQDERMMQKLSFVKFLTTDYPDVITKIQKFAIQKVEYKIQNKKLGYVLEHLKCYEEQKLDTFDICHKDSFKPTTMTANYIELLRKYFLIPFSRFAEPTYYQFNYWVNLFYDSCCSFSGSHQISHKYFVNDYDPAIFKKYKLQKLRSEFFKLLIDNSIQFLGFSVQNLLGDYTKQQMQEGKSKKPLKQIPLLIIPNNNCQWFSFIFRTYNQLPQPIRSFLQSQAVAAQPKLFANKTTEQIQQIIAKRFQVQQIQNEDKNKYQEKLQQILRDISGNMAYRTEKDPGYVLNVDNFIKICLISYKMKVNIPIVIQGQAGIGKTALLRHLIQQVFQYQFYSHTINAGVTQQILRKKIEQAKNSYDQIKSQNQNQHKVKKVCIFFDEFNTLPQLGYIKQLMMQNRFMGDQMNFFKNLIVFAACNPYRSRNINQKLQNKKDKKQKLAFTVKRPPLSIGQIMWNFGSLNEIQMNKYISRMLKEINNDLPNYQFAQLICAIQKQLNILDWGTVSLRDIERLRQLYSWLKQNLPDESKINLSVTVQKNYANKPLRAFIVSLNLAYLNRLDSKAKMDAITKLIDTNCQQSNISYEIMKEFKKTEEDDFAKRIKINYEGISLNSALKQNLYCVFICTMKCLPVIIVGSPGCSKSLAYRIISDNFKDNLDQNVYSDPWLQRFPRIVQFFFQGSQSCLTTSVERRFQTAQQYANNNLKYIKKESDRKIPLFIFDQMGLAERSPDNPLKAIHEPLQLTLNKKTKYGRQIAFLGISNMNLDLSKMSRLLVLRRPDMSMEDLKQTAKQISKGVFSKTNFNHSNLQPYLDILSETYDDFIKYWRQNENANSETYQNFYGLRDFYNLIRTLCDLIKNNANNNKLEQIIDGYCDLAIYRNFNGLTKGYEQFKQKYFRKIKRNAPQKQYNPLQQIMLSLETGGRRYPLVIASDNISQSVFCYSTFRKFENVNLIHGSPFFDDLQKSEYIVGSLSKIVKLVESEKKMIATSLNKTAEGALFDLFNKFFMKRDGMDVYRVAMESGLLLTSMVHPKFNAAVVIDVNEVRHQSSAFLNRFEKYSLDFTLLKNQKIDQAYERVQKQLKKIIQICKSEQLGHYNLENLFFNYTPKTLKSLIWKVAQQNNNYTIKQIEQACLKTLSKVGSKDFEYILNLILCNNEEYQKEQVVKILKNGLNEKQQIMKQCELAIFISNNQDFQSYYNKKDKILSLQLSKNQQSLRKQIKLFMANSKNKQATLFIDFTRQSQVTTGNLNDPIQYFDKDKNQTRIQINYIQNLLSSCKSQLQIEKKPINANKIRIVLNYDRNKKQRFTQVSFMSQYCIFSIDGGNGASTNKSKIFQTVKMRNIIQQSLKNMKVSLAELEQNDQTKKLISQFISQIPKNQSYFAQCCKDALLYLQGNNTQISEQDILSCLRNQKNLQKYNSICTVLIKQYFEKKLTFPICILMMTLNEQKVLYNYTDNAKLSFLSKIIDHFYQNQDPNKQQKYHENMKKFMIEMSKKYITNVKQIYRQKKTQFLQNKSQIQLILNKPTYFPYSHLETSILFSQQMIKRINKIAKTKQNLSKNFSQFEQEYNVKIQQAFYKPQLFTLYKNLTRSTNNFWKRMLMADILILFCQKAKVPIRNVFHFLKQFQEQLKQYQNSFLMKAVYLIGNMELWALVFRILCCFTNFGINKKMQPQRQFDTSALAYEILRYSKKMLNFSERGLKSIKAQNIQQAIKIFIQLHHSVYFQLQNLMLLPIMQERKNLPQFIELTIIEEFITLFENINATQQVKVDLSPLLAKMNNSKQQLFSKIQIISEFLCTLLQNKLKSEKIIYQYLANKMFPSWFRYCRSQRQLNQVYIKFYNLCQRSLLFAHNSLGSVQIALSPLDLQYRYGRIKDIIEVLKKLDIKKQTNLKLKLLIKMCEDCQKQKFTNNLAILINNIFYMNLKRFNSLVRKQENSFTLEDLKFNFEIFTRSITQINQGTSILKIFSFALCKLYLQYYLQVAKPEDQTCVAINQILCENNKLIENLRFYCLRLLRLKYNAKEIYEKYVKGQAFGWCKLFRQQMKQQTSRQIQVPKVPQNMEIPQLGQIINNFKQYQGRDVQLLDQIIKKGSTSHNGRYIVLNLFLKYIYSLAYNSTQYRKKILDHIDSKKQEYTQLMGKLEYELIRRYAESKFDHIYHVDKHQNFNETQLILFNYFNWLLATKNSVSPIHSLFFTNGNLNESIQKTISTSFLPCGPQNPFINIAKIVYADTRNNNIGVYICCEGCDFVYSHLGCGWPSESRDCEMCGKPIGSGGGHKLVRADKGAKRLISPKFIDNSTFYIGQFLKIQQYWDAQRCYIQAQINRMKTKTQVEMSPIINKQRKLEKHNFLGYNISITNNRISTISSKILILCIQCNLYCLVSMDMMKPEECQKLFNNNVKQQVLQQINKRIQSIVKDLREVLNLNTKFYTWIFGIQAQIYSSLINFSQKYAQYVIKQERKAAQVCAKLREKVVTIRAQYKQLYNDMIRVIQAGLTTKQFKQIQQKNLMNASNQFTREVLQQKVEEIVSANLYEGKIAFVQSKYQAQGKMQFPFQPMLNESKYDCNAYAYSRILKTMGSNLTFDQIGTKYEIIIRDRYPILDYLLKNSINFKLLMCFNEVIKQCNIFWKSANEKLSRGYTRQLQVCQFVKKLCKNQIDLTTSTFFKSWKSISKDLGPIQVQCKIFGTMNDQLTNKSPIYNFLLDNRVKQNANGKIIVGIFHNFAKAHNQILGQLKTRKNLIQKYKNMNIFVQNFKLNPQQIAEKDFIIINQSEIMKKILQFSVPSIQYGQNIVHHNFDFCQAFFLQSLKGKFEIEPDIEKYISISFTGQMFSQVSVGTNMNAVAEVRDQAYQLIDNQLKTEIQEWFTRKQQIWWYQLLSQLQKCINLFSKNPKIMETSENQTFLDVIKLKCCDLHLQILSSEDPYTQIQISKIINLFQIVEMKIRPKLKRMIPDKYKAKIQGKTIINIKQYLRNLPKQQNDESPTAVQLCQATQNFVYRNLLSQFMPQQKKIFGFLSQNQSYWPIGYDIYTKNMNICEDIQQLQAKNSYQLMILIEGFIQK